jgi:hypothetical protein
LLPVQDVLQDRREVYRLLQENGIAVPMHIVVNRDGLDAGANPPGFIEEVSFSRTLVFDLTGCIQAWDTCREHDTWK